MQVIQVSPIILPYLEFNGKVPSVEAGKYRQWGWSLTKYTHESSHISKTSKFWGAPGWLNPYVSDSGHELRVMTSSPAPGMETP